MCLNRHLTPDILWEVYFLLLENRDLFYPIKVEFTEGHVYKQDVVVKLNSPQK
jgi:hypothetical protein